MRLARMLKLYIAAEGLEQKKVAEEIGIGESTLSRFMSGDALPAADAFARVLAWCSGAMVTAKMRWPALIALSLK